MEDGYQQFKRAQRERGARQSWAGLGIVAVSLIAVLGCVGTVLAAEGHLIDLSESTKQILTGAAVTTLLPIVFGIALSIRGERAANGELGF